MVNLTLITSEMRPETTPLYNMVPPPGSPSSFAFDVGGFGLLVHVLGDLRSDGDFGLSGRSDDLIAFGLNPVLGVQIHFWGDPSSPTHDYARGECLFGQIPPCAAPPSRPRC